ncbi:hypothetical protein AF332_27575 [Sporosarcina globispora]|uniref:Uncharacterized protein n=1 Tax=Sporosarcina globispora TaxID=1459 RepID=A0A0M0G167_SPOGL|nr:hypothetical protein AF332_27575 [Sporosarcina globispora]
MQDFIKVDESTFLASEEAWQLHKKEVFYAIFIELNQLIGVNSFLLKRIISRGILFNDTPNNPPNTFWKVFHSLYFLMD